jgi:hypothetical protein
MTSVRLLPSEIVRESLLCCTWQLMESRNLRSIIKNFRFKFSSWERWQLPVSWLVLMKIGQELQDVHELNVINKHCVWNMIIEQITQITLPLSVNICKHFVMQTVLQFTSWSLSGFKEQEIACINGCDFAWHAVCSIVRILKSCRRCVGQVSAVWNQEFFAFVTMESISGFISVAWQPLVGQSLLIIQASRSHSFRHTTLGRTPLDVRSVRRRDDTQHLQETDFHVPKGIRIRNPSKRAAADPSLRPRGHRDRVFLDITPCNFVERDLRFGITCCLSLQELSQQP